MDMWSIEGMLMSWTNLQVHLFGDMAMPERFMRDVAADAGHWQDSCRGGCKAVRPCVHCTIQCL